MSTPTTIQKFTVDGELQIDASAGYKESNALISFIGPFKTKLGQIRAFGYGAFNTLLMDGSDCGNGLAFRTNVNQGDSMIGGRGDQYPLSILSNTTKAMRLQVKEDPTQYNQNQGGTTLLTVNRYNTNGTSLLTNSLVDITQDQVKVGETLQMRFGANAYAGCLATTWTQPTSTSSSATDNYSTLSMIRNGTAYENMRMFPTGAVRFAQDVEGLKTIKALTLEATNWIGLPLSPLVLDPVNKYVGIDKTPTCALDVNGSCTISSHLTVYGNITQLFGGTTSLGQTSILGAFTAGGNIVQTAGTSTLQSLSVTGNVNSTGIYQLNGIDFVASRNTDSVAVGPLAGSSSQSTNAIAIGNGAGRYSQGTSAIAIGQSAGGGNLTTGSEQGANSIAIGVNAANTTQGSSCVAIGSNAGRYTQGQSAVAVGNLAGNNTQGEYSVAVGINAGTTSQSTNAVAIGATAANTGQASGCVAVGNNAGRYNQSIGAVAVGQGAGSGTATAGTQQGTYCVALGFFAGNTTQGNLSVAIGRNAGQSSQGTSCLAIGPTAGTTSQGNSSVAIGSGAGNNTQGSSSVAIGSNAGATSQSQNAVAIGSAAGFNTQGNQGLAIGTGAGQFTQGTSGVAIGAYSGNTSQGSSSVAIGTSSGQNTQGASAVAIGASAGFSNQGSDTVAIGNSSGNSGQSSGAVAIGRFAALTNQGANAVAVGRESGNTTQGSSSLAVGYRAGYTAQHNNSIILNATGSSLNSDGVSRFFVKPVRKNNTVDYPLYYNNTSGEIYYSDEPQVALYSNLVAFSLATDTTSNLTFGDEALFGSIPIALVANTLITNNDTKARFFDVRYSVGFAANSVGIRRVAVKTSNTTGNVPLNAVAGVSRLDAASAGETWVCGSCIIKIAAGGSFTLEVEQTSGANLNVLGSSILTVRTI